MSSSEYDKLKKVWYKKLKTAKSEEYPDGFKDIEVNRFELHRSKDYAREVSVLSWEAKEAYYSMARKFLNDYEFENNRERIIWEYHSEGISVRDIVKILKKARLKSVYRRVVWETISRLEKRMKEMYMPGYK